jgi:hypothetical protein
VASRGSRGIQGPPGIGNYQVITGTAVESSGRGINLDSPYPFCPPGTSPLGGGFSSGGSNDTIYVRTTGRSTRAPRVVRADDQRVGERGHGHPVRRVRERFEVATSSVLRGPGQQAEPALRLDQSTTVAVAVRRRLLVAAPDLGVAPRGFRTGSPVQVPGTSGCVSTWTIRQMFWY